MLDNVWLDNPSTFSRQDLVGPLTVIGTKIYSFGKSPSDELSLALYELDTGEDNKILLISRSRYRHLYFSEKIWLPTRAEVDLARELSGLYTI